MNTYAAKDANDEDNGNVLVKIYSDGEAVMTNDSGSGGEWLPGSYKGVNISIAPAITVLPTLADDELREPGEDDIKGPKHSLLHVASLRHYFDVYEEKHVLGARGRVDEQRASSRGDEDEGDDGVRRKMGAHKYMQLAEGGCDLVQRFAIQRHIHHKNTSYCYGSLVKGVHSIVATSCWETCYVLACVGFILLEWINYSKVATNCEQNNYKLTTN